jgi:hypothetical protein
MKSIILLYPQIVEYIIPDIKEVKNEEVSKVSAYLRHNFIYNAINISYKGQFEKKFNSVKFIHTNNPGFDFALKLGDELLVDNLTFLYKHDPKTEINTSVSCIDDNSKIIKTELISKITDFSTTDLIVPILSPEYFKRRTIEAYIEVILDTYFKKSEITIQGRGVFGLGIDNIKQFNSKKKSIIIPWLDEISYIAFYPDNQLVEVGSGFNNPDCKFYDR